MASKHASEVQKIRDRIAVLRDKIAAAEDMRVPIERAYKRADDMIDDLAEEGAIDGLTFAVTDYARPYFHDSRDVLRFLAWAVGDEMKARLRSTIDDHYRGFDGSLDTTETRASIERDRKALFDLEVEEERLIAAAEAAGQPIRRRADADPRAVLAA